MAPLFTSQRNATLESLCLSDIRDSLLPRLMRGEVQSKEVGEVAADHE